MSKFNDYDRKGQQKVMNILPNLFSGCTLNFEQHIDDNGKVDIFMSATTQTRMYKYAIEAKDRWYTHNYFDTWVLEEDKYKELMKHYQNGYKPIYFNTFSDGKYLVWDLSKTDCTNTGNLTTPKTTVEDRGKVTRKRIFLPVSGATYSGTTY